MAWRVVVVLDDPVLAYRTAATLRVAGVEAVAFADPMAALDVLESPRRIEMLVTSLDFALGKPNGVALARIGLLKQPGLRVLFLGDEKLRLHTVGLGDLVQTPVREAELVGMVRSRLGAGRTSLGSGAGQLASTV